PKLLEALARVVDGLVAPLRLPAHPVADLAELLPRDAPHALRRRLVRLDAERHVPTSYRKGPPGSLTGPTGRSACRHGPSRARRRGARPACRSAPGSGCGSTRRR